MVLVRELQGLIQAPDSKSYTNLFGVYDDVQDHPENDFRRRSVRTRKPPTRIPNATEDVVHASTPNLESSDVESSRSLFEEKHEEVCEEVQEDGHEEVQEDEHEDEHQDEPENWHDTQPEKRNGDELRGEHEQRHDHGQEHQEVPLEERDEEPPPKRRKSSSRWPARSNKQHGVEAGSSPETNSLIFKRRLPQDFLAKFETDNSSTSQVSNTKSEPNLPSSLHNVSPSADAPTVHNWLLELAEKLYAASHQTSQRPSPVGKPYVHAMSRQALCETLPYFRSIQGGCYSTDGLVRGFMFDKEANHLDYIDEDVVISRAAGGMMKGTNGKMFLSKDMIENSQIRSLKRNKKNFNPVVIIVGNENPTLQFHPQNTYDVLDFFIITDIWYEKVGNHVTGRFRFEKLQLGKQSWWAPQGARPLARLGEFDPPVRKKCVACGIESEQVFTCDWMCLMKPECSAFFVLSDGQEPDKLSLRYDPRFLKKWTPRPHEIPPYDLRPHHFAFSSNGVLGEDYSTAAAKGICCPKCGRCGIRDDWWECSNPDCKHEINLPHMNILACMLYDPNGIPSGNGYAISVDTYDDNLVDLTTTFTRGHRIDIYKFLDVDATVFHIHSNARINAETNGPDDMFIRAQETGLGLRRRLKPNGQIKGERHMGHFMMNYGVHYKFINEVPSQNFDKADQTIRDARTRLNWAASFVLGEKHTLKFNECLVVGYFEGQKINFHDDGEEGLGPVVATLSLGYPGWMKIRMKDQHFLGYIKNSNSKAYFDFPPKPGCNKYEIRKEKYAEMHARVEAARQNSGSNNARRKSKTKRESEGGRLEEAENLNVIEVQKQIALELGLVNKKRQREDDEDDGGEATAENSGRKERVRKEAPLLLNMRLNHGDIIVMAGEEMQQYYEVSNIHSMTLIGVLLFQSLC